MQNDYDIVIVGGGLVGMSLASALGRSGFRIAVVEAKEWQSPVAPNQEGRTLALAYGSRRIFEGMGLWSQIVAQGVTPIKRIHISDRGRFGITRLDATDAGIDALGYVVQTTALAAVLYHAVQDHESIDLISPAAMKDLVFSIDSVSITVQHANRERKVSARLLVGADGGRSRVRSLAGIGTHEVDYDQTAIVTIVTPEAPHDNVAYERFTDSGPLALLPMQDQRCTVVWSTHRQQADSIMAWDEAMFLQQLQERFGDRLGQFLKVGKRVAYPLVLARVDQDVRARLALVGNAAHTVHPVAGQGFNLGLRDVATLSQILVEAARDGRDIGDAHVVGKYLSWRQRDTRAVTAFTDGLIRLFSNSFMPVAVARNFGLMATDLLPPLKRFLIRRTSGLAGPLPRLARGLPMERI
ncbi:MAG: 2-octaprenyl-6-methoxyphenyl hydroxylase [Acidiferrobacterales bacterium]